MSTTSQLSKEKQQSTITLGVEVSFNNTNKNTFGLECAQTFD